MRWGLLVLSCLVGCLSESSVYCKDGRICPAQTVCAETIHACVLEEQLAACEGKADGDLCALPTIEDGVCTSGVCVSRSMP